MIIDVVISVGLCLVAGDYYRRRRYLGYGLAMTLLAVYWGGVVFTTQCVVEAPISDSLQSLREQETVTIALNCPYQRPF